MFAVVAPLLQAYVYAGVPPATAVVIDPVVPPLQVTDVDVKVATIAVGSVITSVELLLQEFASVTVTVIDPAARFEVFAVVAPLLHKYVYAGVPPATVVDTAPSFAPLQVMLLDVVANVKAEGSVITTVVVCEQLLLSVTVTVYDPVAIFERSSVVGPFDQAYE
jgi:hypothetical protein